MPLRVGTEVAVVSLGRKRGVIVESAGTGRYRVRVENVTVWCREDDLSVAAPGPRKTRAPRQARAAPARTDDAAAPAGRVDLHGLYVDDAMTRVVEEIDRALRRGADRVEVVHGKGTGRIREALHRHLDTMPVVASHRLDPHNPGVTWVYF